jgi:hypothetical protein
MRGDSSILSKTVEFKGIPYMRFVSAHYLLGLTRVAMGGQFSVSDWRSD